MTHPGSPDPGSQPQYGQQGQPQSGGYEQPAQPEYGQQSQPPAGYGQSAQPGYGQQGSYAPAPSAGYGGPAQARPGMVTAAAVLAFISGGLGIIGNLLAFGILDLLPGFFVVLIIVSLIISAALIFGGIQAITGKSFVILIAAAGLAILVNLIALVLNFTFLGLLSFIIPVLIIVFLMNAQSKAWIRARGGATLG